YSPELKVALPGAVVAEFRAEAGNEVLLEREKERTVWRLGRSRGRRLLFVETKVGDPPPGRRERIGVRARIASDHDVMLFADAAHRHFMGTRVRRLESGYSVYEEYPLPSESAPSSGIAKPSCRGVRASRG